MSRNVLHSIILALCPLIFMMGCHHIKPDTRPQASYKSVAVSEAGVELLITRDIHVPEGANVYIHRLELNDTYPPEIIIELRCDALDCTLGTVDYEEEPEPARTAFYIYDISSQHTPVSYTPEPLLGLQHTRIVRDHSPMPAGALRGLFTTSHGYARDGFDEFFTYTTHYTWEEEKGYVASHVREPDSYKYGYVLSINLPLRGAPLHVSLQQKDTSAHSINVVHDADEFYSEVLCLDTLQDFLGDSHRTPHDLSVLLLVLKDLHGLREDTWMNPELDGALTQSHDKIMRAYDELGAHGVEPWLDHDYDQDLRFLDAFTPHSERKTAPSVDALTMFTLVKSLSWPASHKVREWAHHKLTHAATFEELILMTRLLLDISPTRLIPSHYIQPIDSTALHYYEMALDRLEGHLHAPHTPPAVLNQSLILTEYIYTLVIEPCRYKSTSCGLSTSPYQAKCVSDAKDVTHRFLSHILKSSPPLFMTFMSWSTWREDALHVLAHQRHTVDHDILKALALNPSNLRARDTSHTLLLEHVSAHMDMEPVHHMSDHEITTALWNWAELLMHPKAPRLYELDRAWVSAVESTTTMLLKEYVRRDPSLTTLDHAEVVGCDSWLQIVDLVQHRLSKKELHNWFTRIERRCARHPNPGAYIRSSMAFKRCLGLLYEPLSSVPIYMTEYELTSYLDTIHTLLAKAQELEPDTSHRCVNLTKQHARFTPHQYVQAQHIYALFPN